MAFSETIKNEVKKKAHFRCCVCKNYFIEIHHIIPEAAGGPDTIENAAPLCPNCHTNFGDNPTKRKEIKLMRDFWYELCEKNEANPDIINFSQKIDQLYDEFNLFRDNQERQMQSFEEMKSLFTNNFKEQAVQVSTANTIDELILVSGTSTTSPIQVVSTLCKNCGASIPLSDANYCSFCGAKLGV